MSISTLLSIILSFTLFLGSIFISTSDITIFWDPASVVMVVGGTLAAAFVSYEPRYVILSLKLIARIIYTPKVGRDILKAEVGRMIRWAYVMQKGGPPALEAEALKSAKGDKFLTFGLEMVSSGYTGAEMRDILTNLIETSFGRNTVLVGILKAMAANAPAFGMIGTLVGLVIMLKNMAGDPSQLGTGLAVALLTTLYGILVARLIFLPAANKIMQREQIVRFRNYLVAEGLILMADRKSPRYIQDKMNSYLDPSIHFNIDAARK
ncbi:MAG: MotA/TolQ/ExbB proton channel family protein [Rhodospirillales bacterium]|nr:MotA/TolQ/ExbB proton channel family protein [Rhodospirillales bacterium]